MPTIQELSLQISEALKEKEKKAKNVLRILICGSYHPTDKQHLIRLRDKLREEGYAGAFLMEEFEIERNPDNATKFHLIWGTMNESDFRPLIILYAGENSNESTGLNSEIQTVANDSEKRNVATLFKHPNAQLNDFANRIHCCEIEDENDFLEKAFLEVEREKRNILDYLNLNTNQ